MQKKPITDDLIGDELISTIKIPSDDPNVLYRLRIEEGTTLRESHVNRLNQVPIDHVLVEDDEPLFSDIYNKDLQKVHDKTVRDLKQSVVEINRDDVMTESFDELKKDIKRLISVIEKSDAGFSLAMLMNHNTYTAEHSFEVAQLALTFALENVGFFKEKLSKNGITKCYMENPRLELAFGALIHDIGKWNVNHQIITKPGLLSEREWEEMKQHSIYGLEMLNQLDEKFSDNVKAAVLDHHEDWNGTGYPLSKGKTSIHLFGRIVRCCDVFSAITSDRSYKIGLSTARAKEEMTKMQDNKVFDPQIFEKFMDTIPTYPVGEMVTLANGKHGPVVELPEDDPEKPFVRVETEDGETETLQANIEPSLNIIS